MMTQNVTSVDVHDLHERGFKIIPLGSPLEFPPQYFIKRCSTLEEAKEKWSKTPRIQWKEYQNRQPTDEEIDLWIKQFPAANWAIITGKQIVVIDGDSAEACQFIESNLTKTPWKVKTAKGKHYYYQAPGSFAVKNSTDPNIKIDIRGVGGYVVAPGSIHFSGTVYEWDIDVLYGADDFDDLPEFTQNDLITINTYNGQYVKRESTGNLAAIGFVPGKPVYDGSPVQEGERNTSANRYVGKLINKGLSKKEINYEMDCWNKSLSKPLPKDEINTVIKSTLNTHFRNTGETVPLEKVKLDFPLIPLNDLIKEQHQPTWMVEDFIEQNNLGLMFGEPANGKSLIIQELGFCVAIGHGWYGKEVKQGKVAYICGEGYIGIARRFKGIAKKYNTGTDNLLVSQYPASLTLPESAEAVRESILKFSEKPALIIIDTLHRNFGDGDENSAKDFGIFLNNIDKYLRSTGATVIVIHHSGHGNQERSRGSSAIKAAMDVEYMVTNVDGVVTMTCTKSKDFDKPESIAFKIQSTQIDWTDKYGELMEVPTLEQTNFVEPKKRKKLSKHDKVALKTLKEATEKYGVDPSNAIKEKFGGMAFKKVVKANLWRDEMMPYLDVPENDDPEKEKNARRQAFFQSRKRLTEAGIIVNFNDFFWVVDESGVI